MIVKIRGTGMDEDWWVFETNSMVHYHHEMLSVNDIDHGVQHFGEGGKVVGCHGLALDWKIIDIRDIPEWNKVRYDNDGREKHPDLDVKYPFVILEIRGNPKDGPDEKQARILFNTTAYLCNDRGETLQKIRPDWRNFRIKQIDQEEKAEADLKAAVA